MADPATICKEVDCLCRHGFNNETFKTYVLQLLCSLASSLSTNADPVPLAPETVAFGDITTTYPVVPQVDIFPNYYRSITVANSTNQPVLVSVDGTLTSLTVPAGQTMTLAVLRPSQLFFRSVVAPTSGNVVVTGIGKDAGFGV